MSLLLRYSDPRGIDEPAALVSLGSNVRYGQLGVTLSAEVGDGAISSVVIEDPGGIYNFVGLRAFDIRETSAPSNNTVIGRFVIQDRVIGRSKERALITGADRLWTVDLTDYNWHLSSRIHTDADAKRPVETAGDRIRWLLNRAAHINLNDYGNVAYPSDQMDATDYRGQRAADLLADCAVESGYNFWCDFNEAHGKPELFFLDPNGTDYEADIAVSNVYGDWDGASVFEPSMDAETRRSPSRMAFGVYLAYANGSVYLRNDTVGEQYAKIDQTAPMSNVKTAARARRIAQRFLADNDEEDDRLAYEIIVPRAQVNAVRHGQRQAVRFQHVPGYETPVYVRIVKKSVIQDETLGDDFYRLALEAVNTGDAAALPFSGDAFAALLSSSSAGTHHFDFASGDEPIGWFEEDLIGPLSLAESGDPYHSIIVGSSMLARVESYIQFGGVVGGACTVTYNLTVNGVSIGQDTDSTPDLGLYFWGGVLAVDVRDVLLNAGDVVSFTYVSDPNWSGMGSSGANLTYLRVGRGTIVMNSGTYTWVGP